MRTSLCLNPPPPSIRSPVTAALVVARVLARGGAIETSSARVEDAAICVGMDEDELAEDALVQAIEETGRASGTAAAQSRSRRRDRDPGAKAGRAARRRPRLGDGASGFGRVTDCNLPDSRNISLSGCPADP